MINESQLQEEIMTRVQRVHRLKTALRPCIEAAVLVVVGVAAYSLVHWRAAFTNMYDQERVFDWPGYALNAFFSTNLSVQLVLTAAVAFFAVVCFDSYRMWVKGAPRTKLEEYQHQSQLS